MQSRITVTPYRKTFSIVLMLFLLVGVTAIVFSSTVLAQAEPSNIFVVTKTDDTDDGICDADCSLREAINAANLQPGQDTIAFNIPTNGPHTIRPSSPLPEIFGSVIVDGYTQPGAQPNTNPAPHGLNTVLMIELDGSNAGRTAFDLYGVSDSTIRGLAINRFSGPAITVNPDVYASVEGNFIGTDISGMTAMGNGDGVEFQIAGNNTVGGQEPSKRNLISGNQGAAIFANESLVTIQGNLIGTDAAGTSALGNLVGVSLGSGSYVIGDNVISGNREDGVRLIGSPSNGVDVHNNQIGTDSAGNPLGNGGHGVNLNTAANSSIAENTIAYNQLNGIAFGGIGYGGNRFESNRIFANGGLGIDLGNDGVTLNDPEDTDTGPNELQNFPLVSLAGSGRQETVVHSTFNSVPDQTYTLQFFSNDACDPSGYGEGETLLGDQTVMTDGSGNAVFTANFAGKTPVGSYVTATAMDASGNTSEFSACQEIAGIINRSIRPSRFPRISYDRTPNPPLAPEGVLTIRAKFKNVSQATLTDVFFKTNILTRGNIVMNAEGEPAGVGSIVAVPGSIAPRESFTVQFDIGLQSRRFFIFHADAYGLTDGAVHDAAQEASDSFAFDIEVEAADIDTSQIYLPLITQ